MTSRALSISGSVLAAWLGASLVCGCTPHRATPELSIVIDDDLDAEASRRPRAWAGASAPEAVAAAWARASNEDGTLGQPVFPATFSPPADSRARSSVICEYKACIDDTDPAERCGYRPCGQPFPVRTRLPDAIDRDEVPGGAAEAIPIERAGQRARTREPDRPAR